MTAQGPLGLPVAAFQTRTVPSSDALAMCSPSGLNATSRTTPRCPLSTIAPAAVESLDDDLGSTARDGDPVPGGIERRGEQLAARAENTTLRPSALRSQSRAVPS